MSHVHIIDDTGVIGTLFLDRKGHVADDGSAAASNAIDYTPHGHKREDGQAALDAIVEHLGRSTYVGARHCNIDHRHATTKGEADQLEAAEDGSSDRASTQPTPQDPWPEWGELTNEEKHHEIQWGDSGHGLVE
jgi:hypothetical protein